MTAPATVKATPHATTFAVLTPPGRGAIAVVRVRGPGSVAAVDAAFDAANGKPLAEQPPGAIRFGRWNPPAGRAAPNAGEELVVCRTAADAVEVHCHGGDAAVRAIASTLANAGCTEVRWQEEIRRTADDPFAADAITADAVEALSHCVTERTAAVLMDQLSGVLSSELQALAGDIQSDATPDRLRRLLDRSTVGLRLTRPWRVVLAGPPNVGKSSLINALVGYERAIVYDQPGVTRDVVTAVTAVDGWPVELADTAGLRAPGDALEAAGIDLARATAAAADVLLLVDAYEPGGPPPHRDSAERQLERLGLEPLRGDQRLLRVANKADLAPADADPPAGVVATSTVAGVGGGLGVSGLGVDALLAPLAGLLVPDPPAPGEAVPFTPAQVEQLRVAERALGAGDFAAARAALLSLLA